MNERPELLVYYNETEDYGEKRRSFMLSFRLLACMATSHSVEGSEIHSNMSCRVHVGCSWILRVDTWQSTGSVPFERCGKS
jgi:hypothetical protein